MTRPMRCDCAMIIPGFDWTAIFDRVRIPTRYAPGTTFLTEGQRLPGLFVVCTGAVKATVTTVTGKSVVLHVHHAGDVIGLADLFTGGDSGVQASTLFESDICVFPWRDFQATVFGDARALAAITNELGRTVKAERQRVRSMLSPSARARIIGFLQNLRSNSAAAYSRPTTVPFPYTQEELAELIGCTRESVGRLLRELSAAGAVQRRGLRLTIASDFDRRVKRTRSGADLLQEPNL
jgi:CRP/FNR family transcriptional regulator, cyclic AMP receptor protein